MQGQASVATEKISAALPSSFFQIRAVDSCMLTFNIFTKEQMLSATCLFENRLV